ncbi:MAG TPA: DUF1588 domain-containing protein [Polyangia bacterium]|jgi:hypothetical protein|nr:DUF1588 domain-containing protein [Polyangia bacterium]
MMTFARVGAAALFIASCGLGCVGTVTPPGGGPPGSRAGSGGATVAGSGGTPSTGGTGSGGASPSPADMMMKTANPDLFALVSKYFPNTAGGTPAKRMVRLTRTQLDLTTKTLLPAHVAAAGADPLPPDPLQTNYEYAANLTFSPANFTPYTKWVDTVTASVRTNPSTVINCAAGATACLQTEAKKFVARAFRGTLPETQLTRYAALLTDGVAAVGLPDAVADLVNVTLTSPNFVYRDEVLTDAASTLLPAQRLQNLTYTLADAPPETVGLSSVTPSAGLTTPDQLQATIDRLLATPEARAKLMRFFLSWLEVKEADQFTIAPTVFPEFTPALADAMIDEAKAFLNAQLSKAAPALKDVTQSTQSFVSDALASIYGVAKPGTAKLISLDPTQRLGIFTLPAVIASHSGPDTTRLVKRGVFFTRKVMCMPLGQPPPGTNTVIPADAKGTERQKVESVTQTGTCVGCHSVINPFGFMQENYDPLGRWRTTDNGFPIDAKISLGFLDEGALTTDNPVDALKGLTGSLRFKQCFARQLFRFYTGRDEGPADDPVLREMVFGFANNDAQALVPLLRVLAASASFSNRMEAP